MVSALAQGALSDLSLAAELAPADAEVRPGALPLGGL